MDQIIDLDEISDIDEFFEREKVSAIDRFEILAGYGLVRIVFYPTFIMC